MPHSLHFPQNMASEISRQTVDFYIEFSVQAVLISLQTIVVRFALERYKVCQQDYHFRIALSHLFILLAILLGVAASCVAYLGFTKDYSGLLIAFPEDNSNIYYLLYRSIYIIELFVYQIGIFLMFWVQLDRFSVLVATTNQMVPMIAKALYHL
jgi:hypothetical protein